jgi:hypothetical protein
LEPEEVAFGFEDEETTAKYSGDSGFELETAARAPVAGLGASTSTTSALAGASSPRRGVDDIDAQGPPKSEIVQLGVPERAEESQAAARAAGSAAARAADSGEALVYPGAPETRRTKTMEASFVQTTGWERVIVTREEPPSFAFEELSQTPNAARTVSRAADAAERVAEPALAPAENSEGSESSEPAPPSPPPIAAASSEPFAWEAEAKEDALGDFEGPSAAVASFGFFAAKTAETLDAPELEAVSESGPVSDPEPAAETISVRVPATEPVPSTPVPAVSSATDDFEDLFGPVADTRSIALEGPPSATVPDAETPSTELLVQTEPQRLARAVLEPVETDGSAAFPSTNAPSDAFFDLFGTARDAKPMDASGSFEESPAPGILVLANGSEASEAFVNVTEDDFRDFETSLAPVGSAVAAAIDFGDFGDFASPPAVAPTPVAGVSLTGLFGDTRVATSPVDPVAAEDDEFGEFQ